MAVVTFDPDNLRIVEIDTAQAVNEIDALDIYGDWKKWLLADTSRLGFPQAFTEVAGDPITGSQSVGIVYFLENRWRIRPAEYSHKLVINGDIFTREPSESIFVTTLGAFNVHTETFLSNLVRQIVTSGVGTPAEVSDAVWGTAYTATPGTYGDVLYRTFVMLGMHPTIEVVHGDTYIKAPADGSVLSLKLTKGSGVTTIERQ